MEFHSMHKILHPNHLGEEKQQMLNLNRRLETYLSRVKMLEEENELLANEIKALRRNNQGALALRKGLEQELQQARLEVDAAWRERVLTELEVEKLNEEIQDLELQRQREAQAKVMVKTKLEQSRREMEEEQRAQIWLREKVNQLENEMRHLSQTHEEDVAHLEATLTRSRATMPPTLAQRVNQTPDLIRMGHEFSQQATRAWQEAEKAHQSQLARLEESLNQARSRLNQVFQEKHESQLKLQALEKEIASAQDVRLHLEKTVAQRKEEHEQEIQQLQEHLEDLEVEKEELAQQIDHLLLENHSLMQLKMSLGLEVTTYRALLDSESIGADGIFSNKPRNISIRDVVLSPHGVKKNYRTQMSANLKTTFPSSVYGITGSSVTAAQIVSRKPPVFNEAPKISSKPAETNKIKSATLEIPYPKVFQEVQEEVLNTEPVSPSTEQHTPDDVMEEKSEEEWNIADAEPTEEQTCIESVVSQKVESSLRSEQPLDDEAGLHHFTTPSQTSHIQPRHISDEPDKTPCKREDKQEDVLQLQIQADASEETQNVEKEVEYVQEETSDSATEVEFESNFEPSSQESESEPAERVFNQVTDHSTDGNFSNEDAAVMKQEPSTSVVGTDAKEVEDKLYPDGEEMDTWDSVIERKVNVMTDDIKNEKEKQHAEPEEDISAKEPEDEIRKADQSQNMSSTVMLPQADDGQHMMLDQGHPPPPDKEGDNDEEDSQNVSLSWRTELESDSYAQENTLADTRPLIRYKSDDTDANTQASHIDESESSEGEQEKKMEEPGIGTWSDGKSKTFGTMEDLCEEVEEETIDEEYNLGYFPPEDRDVSPGTIVSEHGTLVDEREHEEEMLKKVSQEYSEKETEEATRVLSNTDVEYEEEPETDKHVEQELDSLSADNYSPQFAHLQVKEEIFQMENNCVEDVGGKGEAEKMTSSSYCEPEMSVNHEHPSVIDQTLDNQHLTDPYTVMSLTETAAEEEVQRKDQETIDKPEKEEEGREHNTSTVPGADETEDHSGFTDFIYRPEMEDVEEPNNPQDQISVLLETADQKNVQEAPEVIDAHTEIRPNDSQDEVIKDTEDFPKIPNPAESAGWEVLENPTPEFEIKDQNKHDQKNENIPKSADDDIIIHQKENVEFFPDSEHDIFMVKDVTDSSLFPHEVKNDFWVSSLESGATYEPDNTNNKASEQSYPNQGFTYNQNLENPYVVNGNSKPDVALATMKDQEQMNMEGKTMIVYSEDSEAEGESWSSGEEPV